MTLKIRWKKFPEEPDNSSNESDSSDSSADEGEVKKKMRKNTTVFQTLSFSLGQSDQPARTFHGYMATVKKISRGVSYLPPIKTLPEWFNYAFRCSEMDDVARFPSLSGGGGGERERHDSKVQQRTEEIFALPCLRMDLKTEHVQREKPPSKEDPKPVVVCSFVTGKKEAMNIVNFC